MNFINLKVGDRPVTFAYELLARCRHLVLAGRDEDGDLEWVGTKEQWQASLIEEEDIVRNHIEHKPFAEIWK